MTDEATNVTPIRTGGTGKKRGVKRGDSWDTTDSGYNRDRFYTASIVGDGDSEKVYMKVDTGVWARVCSFGNNPAFPNYRTPHDVVRDALIHRMHDLVAMKKDQDPDIEKWLKMQVRKGEIARMQNLMRACKEVVVQMSEAFSEAEAGKDWHQARELVGQAEEAIEELDEPYSGDLMRLVQDFERRIPSKTAVTVRKG